MQHAICIFCGSRSGKHLEWSTKARTLGEEIAKREWTLVFGGGSNGLMGEISNGAFSKKGKVTGIIPRSLLSEKPDVEHLSKIYYVDTMTERKQLMLDLSTAFVIIPGGIGTLDELFEVWVSAQTGFINKPIFLANWNGYYDGLLHFLDTCIEQGMVTDQHLKKIQVIYHHDELFKALDRI